MQVKAGSSENQMINTNLQAQEKAAGEGRRKAAKQERKATVFAGDLSLHKDSISIRRHEAQKRAMKFVQDAWDADRKVGQSMDELRAVREMQQEEVLRNRDQAKELADKRESLREEYGVDPESHEQKDLELLMRAVPPYDGSFTEEEQARLAELKGDPLAGKQGQPLTEYQERCIAIYQDQKVFEQRAKQAEDYAAALQSSQTDMKIEKLKNHKMADAQKKAEKEMQQASEEIQGMMVDEAKDHVDETYEETREEAEKKAEEQEAEEEKVALRREQKEMLEARVEESREDSREAEKAQREQEKDAREEAALLKDMSEAGMNVAGAGDTAKAEIKDMLNKLKLIEADIKGIKVDEEA